MGKMIDKTKGKLKQAVGSLTGNAKLKRDGADDERKGNIEGAAKDLKRAAKNVKSAFKGATR